MLCNFKQQQPHLKEGARSGSQVGVQEGAAEEEMLLSTAGGRILRTPVSSIRASSRAARGGLVSKLQEGDTVQAITVLQPNESA